MVTLSISQSVGAIDKGEDLGALLDHLVENRGLRLKISYIGITGMAYLELDFVDPEKNSPMKIKWEPNNYYVPSVPNTFELITESINDISDALTADFIPLIENLNRASNDLPELTTTLTETFDSLKLTLDELRRTAKNIPEVTRKIDRTLYHLNQIFENEAYDVQVIIDDLQQITDDLRVITSDLRDNPSHFLFGSAPEKSEVITR